MKDKLTEAILGAWNKTLDLTAEAMADGNTIGLYPIPIKSTNEGKSYTALYHTITFNGVPL